MSTASVAVAALDSSLVVNCRKTPSGQILPKQVISKSEDGSSENYDFDERGRVYRMVRYADDGETILLNRAWPTGTSLHELGLLEMNSEVQRILAKNRREHGGA